MMNTMGNTPYQGYQYWMNYQNGILNCRTTMNPTLNSSLTFDYKISDPAPQVMMMDTVFPDMTHTYGYIFGDYQANQYNAYQPAWSYPSQSQRPPLPMMNHMPIAPSPALPMNQLISSLVPSPAQEVQQTPIIMPIFIIGNPCREAQACPEEKTELPDKPDNSEINKVLLKLISIAALSKLVKKLAQCLPQKNDILHNLTSVITNQIGKVDVS